MYRNLDLRRRLHEGELLDDEDVLDLMMDDWMDDTEAMNNFLIKQHQEADKSYENYPNAERRYCFKCGELLPYRSMAYDEGWHFDSCI